MKVLVTGGSGFIGSHVCEHFASLGNAVVAYDNLSRSSLLLKKEGKSATSNWNFLKTLRHIKTIRGSTLDYSKLKSVMEDVDAIVHTAAQTAVTTSLTDPRTDFNTNLLGTFNVLEAARNSKTNPCIVFCSTNKVYGENVNSVPIIGKKKRYAYEDPKFRGISESFSIDQSKHTPYGCSKLGADLYVQDYAHTYGMRTAVFRMSCIYGPRQFGVEDQGWLAWFVIANLTGQEVTVYGDGKQVRDALFVEDLVRAFQAFITSGIEGGVYNMGGGSKNTISILELIDMVESLSRKKFKIAHGNWRSGDQKVYISDIGKAMEELKWAPRVGVEKGVGRLYDWVQDNMTLFKQPNQ